MLGANAPELQRKIMSNLEKEKKILKEGGTRDEVRGFVLFCSLNVSNRFDLVSF